MRDSLVYVLVDLCREKKRDIARIKEELRSKGAIVPPDKPASEHFDSNCITPVRGSDYLLLNAQMCFNELKFLRYN